MSGAEQGRLSRSEKSTRRKYRRCLWRERNRPAVLLIRKVFLQDIISPCGVELGVCGAGAGRAIIESDQPVLGVAFDSFACFGEISAVERPRRPGPRPGCKRHMQDAKPKKARQQLVMGTIGSNPRPWQCSCGAVCAAGSKGAE